jgi:hypothetical protein
MKKRTKIIVLILAAIVLLFCLSIGRLFVANIFSGRVHFPGKDVGATLKMEDGKEFKVFRRLQVEGREGSHGAGAVFKVRFRFKSLELETNKRLSMIPAPFLMGIEGFREKYWTFHEKTDEFQGIYQWESKESAENYPDSFIFKLMTKRAAPGTLSYEIIPDTDLSKYIEKAITEK